MQLIGIGLIVLAVLAFNESKKREQRCTEEILAIISRIDSYSIRRNGRRRTEHDVYIEYTYADKMYETELKHYTSTMDEGDTVKIYVNPSNPEEIYHKSSSIAACIILIILGIVFFVSGFFVS